MHRVGTGETLAAIAQRYKTSPGSIATANKLVAAAETVEGDRLVIPAVRLAMPASRTPSRAPARRGTVVRQAHATPASKSPAVVRQARAGAVRRASRPASKSAAKVPTASRTASVRPDHKQPVMVAEGSAR